MGVLNSSETHCIIKCHFRTTGCCSYVKIARFTVGRLDTRRVLVAMSAGPEI